MFRVVVCKIVGALAPMDKEMALADAIPHPIKAHIHGFGPSLFDGIIADAGGAGVVGLDGSGWLWVLHVFEDGSEHGGFLRIVE